MINSIRYVLFKYLKHLNLKVVFLDELQMNRLYFDVLVRYHTHVEKKSLNFNGIFIIYKNQLIRKI